MSFGSGGIRKKQLEEIVCRGEAGRTVRIIHFRFVTTEATANGPRDRIGAHEWQTVSGEKVKLIDADLYEVASSGELLRRLS